ncbi:MAG: TonB-dependent receptor [Betaproteobacteria bacterium]|nr:TonB-dependent receptor [Betaproteobacteria bacterium]
MLLSLAFSPLSASAQATPPEEKKDEKEQTTLPTVNVKDAREEQKGYQAGTTNVGKSKQLPRDIPQAVTIVPEQLIRDRGADTFREALRNVPSLTFNAGEGGRIGDNITLRGYSVVGDLYLDNMRDIAQYNRDTFNYEQIDVLRGSASMLYGRGSTGGIINQVSKMPRLHDGGSASLSLGNYNYRRFTADLNREITDNAAVRVNLMRMKSDSFRDYVKSDRSGVAPAVRWGIGTPDEFYVGHYYLEYNDIPDYGVPYFQGRPLKVPVNRFYGLPNADYQRDRANISTAGYTHVFGADAILKTVLRAGNYTRDLRAVAPRLIGAPTVIDDNTGINRQRQSRGGEEHTLTSQTDFTAYANAGGLKHALLIGAELVDEKASRWNLTGAVANPATTVLNPNPIPALPAAYFSFSRSGEVSYKAHTAGLYAQDTVEFTPHWKLVAGARLDNFHADYDRAPPAGPLQRTDRVPSLRTGLLYQPGDEQSYYLAYGTSFNPSAELYALDDRGANTPPEKSRNIEAGAKWELLEGDLSLRTALFRSEKTNERNTDLSVSVDQNLLSGKRHSDGIELEVMGRISERWGIERVADRYANADNSNIVPAYTRIDMLLAYEQKSYAIKLNVLNLFDKDYYEGVYQGHSVPGTKRSMQVTAEYKF